MRNTIIAIVVIVLIALGIWYFSKPKTSGTVPENNSNVAVNNGSKIGAAVIDAGGVVGGSVDKVNPFDVKVNPYDGYKNPFAK